jgi:hypothetical protein
MDFNNLSHSPQFNRWYSGDLISPDSIDIVVKKDQNFHCHTFLSGANGLATIPVYGSICAIKRIINAVKVIFQELKNDSYGPELKNAFKNLGRGLIELIPFSFLILLPYDLIQNRQRLSKLEQDIRLEEDVAKIFVNGLLAETIPLDAIDTQPLTGEAYKIKLKNLCAGKYSLNLHNTNELINFRQNTNKLIYFRNYLNELRDVLNANLNLPEPDELEPVLDIDDPYDLEPVLDIDDPYDLEPEDDVGEADDFEIIWY